jgi:antitoxin HicB
VSKHQQLIEHFMDLPYRIEIVKIPDGKGGGFMARLPQFGRMAAMGDGETINEAITDLEESKRALFETYISEGIEIPDPDTFEEDFSGKFVLRVPKYMHRHLAQRAKENDTSLNSFVIALLASALYEDRTSSAWQSLEAEINMLRKDVCNLTYKMAPGSITLPRVVYEADDTYDEGRAA